MIIDSVSRFGDAKIESQKWLPDYFMYSIVVFRFNSDFSILCNRENDISRSGNTGFPQLVGKNKISDMQSIQIKIRPSWTNSL